MFRGRENGDIKTAEKERKNKSMKYKTNPMVCNPNPILSPKIGISTNLENLFMQNEPNGMYNET